MTKIIVEIFVVSLNQTLDFMLPSKMPVQSLIELIIETLRVHTKMDFSSKGLILSHIAFDGDCDILHPKATLSNQGVKDGAKLILA